MKYWYILYEEYDAVKTGIVDARDPSLAAEEALIHANSMGARFTKLVVALADQVTVFNDTVAVGQMTVSKKIAREAKALETKERAEYERLKAKYEKT